MTTDPANTPEREGTEGRTVYPGNYDEILQLRALRERAANHMLVEIMVGVTEGLRPDGYERMKTAIARQGLDDSSCIPDSADCTCTLAGRDG